MSRLENRLREVLKHEDPPSGFAERVLARANEPKQNAWSGLFARHRLAVALSCALGLMLMVGGMEYRQRQVEKAQSEAAKQQLMLALQIAGEQLQFVQSKIIQP
jgi:hypothetical protein